MKMVIKIRSSWDYPIMMLIVMLTTNYLDVTTSRALPKTIKNHKMMLIMMVKTNHLDVTTSRALAVSSFIPLFVEP